MEQRRLRLGDILDDYCPRERRVTNHAVVAMIEEDVKQTRCTTCDAEHAYKGARVPKRRKKDTPAALYTDVLAGMAEPDQPPVLASSARPVTSPTAMDEDDAEPTQRVVIASQEPVITDPQREDPHSPMHTDDNDQPREIDEPTSRIDSDVPAVDGPVHRPLIRATLPRPEGQKDTRPVPEFTVRQAPGRPNGNGQGGFRGERVRMRAGHGYGNGHGSREPNGNRAPGGQKFHGNRSGRAPGGRPGPAGGYRSNGGSGKRGRGPRG